MVECSLSSEGRNVHDVELYAVTKSRGENSSFFSINYHRKFKDFLFHIWLAAIDNVFCSSDFVSLAFPFLTTSDLTPGVICKQTRSSMTRQLNLCVVNYWQSGKAYGPLVGLF